MAGRSVKLWYDKEGGFLEVTFEGNAGSFHEVDNDRVMDEVDNEGNVPGFPVIKVSKLSNKPIEVALH